MKNKTPAVLLYYEDFLTGTSDMTDEEVGQYIRMLCYQNAKGHLSMDLIRRSLKRDPLEYVLAKFEQDADGNYYNARMESEIDRRVKYSDSRAKNRAKATCVEHINDISITHDKDMSNISKTHEKHMETETETETETVSITKDNEEDRRKVGNNPAVLQRLHQLRAERNGVKA